MAALNYGTVGSNQLEKAKAFYDALLGSIGFRSVLEHGSGGRIYAEKGGSLFGVVGPYDGKPASSGNGAMFAFGFDTREEVAAFHAKAIALGAVDDGAAGARTPTFFAAYFRDLDNNKICGFTLT